MLVDLTDGGDAHGVDSESGIEGVEVTHSNGGVLLPQAAVLYRVLDQLLADAIELWRGGSDQALLSKKPDVGDRRLGDVPLGGDKQRVVIAGSLGLFAMTDLRERTRS